jgi:hypothetical protein
MGTYETTVPTLPFRTQTVRVVVKSAHSGQITMRGMVTLTDTFTYRYDAVHRTWSCTLGDNTVRELRRWHCSLSSFAFDSKRNEARVVVSLPFKTMRLVLAHVTD